jgi:uncharacterized protein (TIGR00288 family)
MIKHKDQRVGVFVDVQNMYHSAKHLYQAKVNFKKVLDQAVSGRKLIRALAYVIKSKSSEEQKFFEALDKQGFELKMKDLQIFFGGAKKGDWDVGLAMDIIRLSNKLDVVVLVSGDGDFIPLVEYLKNHGHFVEIIAFGRTVSSKLVEEADEFVDLEKNAKEFLIIERKVRRKR